MSASETILSDLHAALAKELLDTIKNGVPMFDKEGNETGTRKATAAEMAVAVTFLKANDITADLESNDEAKALKEALEARRKQKGPAFPDYLESLQ